MWTAPRVKTCRKCHDGRHQHHRIDHRVVDAAPDPRAHCAAPAHGGAHAAAARRAPAHQGHAQHHLDLSGPGGGRAAAGAGQGPEPAGRPGRVPARQLARALWHRADHRSALSHDAGAVQHRGAGHRAVLCGALAPRGRALSPVVPVPAHGAGRCLPHRRPVQPVRVLRDHAGRLVRAAAAWLGAPTRVCRAALHCHQPRSLLAVPDWRVDAVWHHRYAQHGRPGAEHCRHCACRPRPAACGGGHPGGGFSHQGRCVAAQLLAGTRLQRGHGARGRTVCADDQGGRVQRAAAVDAALWPRGR
ncbi:hypothetical protein D3C71_1331320 [compost metagenome]